MLKLKILSAIIIAISLNATLLANAEKIVEVVQGDKSIQVIIQNNTMQPITIFDNIQNNQEYISPKQTYIINQNVKGTEAALTTLATIQKFQKSGDIGTRAESRLAQLPAELRRQVEYRLQEKYYIPDIQISDLVTDRKALIIIEYPNLTNRYEVEIKQDVPYSTGNSQAIFNIIINQIENGLLKASIEAHEEPQ